MFVLQEKISGGRVGETQIRWAPDWEEFQCWLNNLVDARNIGRWGCEGFVGILTMWELKLRLGVSLLLLCFTRSGPPIACTC